MKFERTHEPFRGTAMESRPKSIKTSVIIPVYNTEEYLAACLDSVLAQTQREIEVILVDDGSTDGSLAIERAYAAADSRVYVITQQNLRQGTARNRGLERARGEFVYFMDSDDLIMPDLLETCYCVCTEDELDFVTFDSQGFIDDPDEDRSDLFTEICDRSGFVDGEVMDGVEFWNRYHSQGGTPLICWLDYFKRDFLMDNNLKFLEGIYFEDNDWTARVFLAAKRMRYVPMTLHRYRHRAESNVHAGFTNVLADTCFDVLDALCDLLVGQDTPPRRRIVRDVLRVLNHRFAQFGELVPDVGLWNKTESFVASVLDINPESELDSYVYVAHREALCAIACGTKVWEGFPRFMTSAFAKSVLLEGLPSADEASRIGLYGLGRACRLLLDFLREDTREFVLFDSNPPQSQFFEGRPVYSISDADSWDLDGMVVTSSKFRYTLVPRAREALGEDVPIVVIPWSTLYYAHEACNGIQA